MLGHAIVLEHVQECCFTGVVETQEEKLAGLFPQAEVRQDIAEPVPEKHFEQRIKTTRPEVKRKLKNAKRKILINI